MEDLEGFWEDEDEVEFGFREDEDEVEVEFGFWEDVVEVELEFEVVGGFGGFWEVEDGVEVEDEAVVVVVWSLRTRVATPLGLRKGVSNSSMSTSVE